MIPIIEINQICILIPHVNFVDSIKYLECYKQWTFAVWSRSSSSPSFHFDTKEEAVESRNNLIKVLNNWYKPMWVVPPKHSISED